MREKPVSGFRKKVGPLAAGLAFLSSFCFFQFAYPYHLIKREQANLFVYDGDYIAETYRGMGWLARFIADFLEQFFHLPVAGPLIVALLVTGIGIVVLQQQTGIIELDPASYYVSTAPMELNIPLVVALNIATLLISVFVLIAPSFLISHIHPAKSMHYE